MTKFSLLGFCLALTISLSSFAQKYYNLDDVRSLQCNSALSNTAVTVERVGKTFEITIRQGTRLLHDHVPNYLTTAERFPALFIYQG